MAKTTSQKGIDLITEFEGLRLTAYRDSVGVLTIGYGHTNNTASADKYPVSPGQTITASKAKTILKADLVTYENAVNRYVTVSISQNQFDALVSFSFNVGTGALHSSDLLTKLNNGNVQGAADEFDLWIHAGGEVLPGLVKRREAEKKLFLNGETGGGNGGSDGNGSTDTYVVQSGDTLSEIAVKFNVTVSQLQDWNNISDPNDIQIGQELIVEKPSGGGDNGSGGGSSKTYTVQSGDTLSEIAVKFDVTVSQLQDWNNISDPNDIQIGQELIVKKPSGGGDNGSGGSSSETYTVQSGDTLSEIEVKFDVTVTDLMKWNNISNPDSIQIGQELTIINTSGEGSSGQSYTVQSGDTLSEIAVKFDVTVSNLMKWNNISNPDSIQVGQELVIK